MSNGTSDTSKVLRGWMREGRPGAFVSDKKTSQYNVPVQVIPVPEHGFCIGDRVLIEPEGCQLARVLGYTDTGRVWLQRDGVQATTHDPLHLLPTPERTYTEEQVCAALDGWWYNDTTASHSRFIEQVIGRLRGDSCH